MPLPLKQGLKLSGFRSVVTVMCPCNAPSTKTRIETHNRFDVWLRRRGLAMPLPLKQGLKPHVLALGTKPGSLAMPLPLKQGLKHNERFAVPHGIYLAMPLPLKQGLKPRWQTRPGPSTRPLAMPLPIKQGLKLARKGPRSRRGLHPCNAPSNKTRIETIKRCNFLQVCPRNAPSNKTRIETRINLEDMPFDHLQCPFH